MMRLDAGWLRRDPRSVLRLAIATVLVAPAILLGAGSTPPGGDDIAWPAVRPAVVDDAAVARESARLDAVFARHYDIPLELAARIHHAARGAGIDPVLAFGLVDTESSFRRTAVSWAGAVGYTQLMPATARWMEPGLRRVDLFETETNLEIGFEYLRYLLEYYEGDVRLALTAYNRGPGTVDQLLEQGRDPENGYADKVLGTEPRGGLRRLLRS
jgi:soluble lytic murein transglycosylase-like protein